MQDAFSQLLLNHLPTFDLCDVKTQHQNIMENFSISVGNRKMIALQEGLYCFIKSYSSPFEGGTFTLCNDEELAVSRRRNRILKTSMLSL